MRPIDTQQWIHGLVAATLAVVLTLSLAACGGGGGASGAPGADTGADAGADAGSGSGGSETPVGTIFEARLLAGGLFRGVWGTASDDLFGVGGTGLLAHYDGASWTPFEPPSGLDEDLHAVFGFSSSNVYAVGNSGTILHFDGTDWTQETITPATGNTLYDIWGSGPSDIYVAGASALVHFDGATWTRISNPVLSGVNWRGISGSGPNDILLAGEGGGFQTAHFIQYDGATFHSKAVPPVAGSSYFNSVHCTGPDEALIVGLRGRTLTWDGTSLNEQTAGTNESLVDVWGASATQMYAVGVRNTFLRWNGSSWSDINFDLADDALSSIFGFAGNDVVTGGRGVYHYDGATLEPLLHQSAPQGAWVGGPTNALILGSQTLRFDGQSVVAEDFGGLTVPTLTAAWGPANNIIAVGVDGSAFLYNGMAWGAMTTNNTSRLSAVWGAAPDDVFAVGRDGTIMHFNGVAWGDMNSGTLEHLADVWGTSGDNVYAVGANGTILHYDGTTWAPVAGGVTDYLSDIQGFSATSMLIGYSGGVLVGSGISWTPEIVDFGGTPQAVTALSGTSIDNIFFSLSGRPAHGDGTMTRRLSGLQFATFVEALNGSSFLAGGRASSFDERVILYSAR